MLRRSPSVITISEKDVAELRALVEVRAAAKKMEGPDKAINPAPPNTVASAAMPPNAVTEQK